MRTKQDIATEYAKECVELGEFFVNAVFRNKGILAKYKKIKALDTEFQSLPPENTEESK